jgi:hypothetical protein
VANQLTVIENGVNKRLGIVRNGRVDAGDGIIQAIRQYYFFKTIA